MAIQLVGRATGVTAGATSGIWSVSLTALTGGIASSAAIGDIVVTVVATGATSPISQVNDAGYTQVKYGTSAGSSYGSAIEVCYKVLTATTTSVSFIATGDAKAAGAAVVMVFRGVHPTTPMDVTRIYTSGTGTGRPNPGAITPVSAGAYVVALGAATSGTGSVFTSSDLSVFTSVSSVDTYDAMVGAGYFAWESGAFDPAQWAGGTTLAGDAWNAITIALRPNPPPNINFPALGTSFVRTGVQATFQVKPYSLKADSKALSVTGFATSLKSAIPPVLITAPTLVAGQLLSYVKVSANGLTLGVQPLNSSTVYIYRRTSQATWVYDTSFTAPRTVDAEGWAISGDGNTFVSGNYSVVASKRQSNGTWQASTVLGASRYRVDVDYAGTRIVACDNLSNELNTVSVFNYNGSSWVNSGVSIVGSTSTTTNVFGSRIRLSNDGNSLFVSESTSIVYEFVYADNTWTEANRLVAEAYLFEIAKGSKDVLLYHYFASSVYYRYVKRKSGSTWSSGVEVSLTNYKNGHAITDDGTRVFVGDRSYLSNRGRITEFVYSDEVWAQSASEYICPSEYGAAQFGTYVAAASDGWAAFGSAPYYSPPGYANAGAVLAFVRRFPFQAAKADFSLIGYDAGLAAALAGVSLPALPATFSLTGVDAGLTKVTQSNPVLSAAKGDLFATFAPIRSDDTRLVRFSLVGASANLYTRVFSAGYRAFPLTFYAARLHTNSVFVAIEGTTFASNAYTPIDVSGNYTTMALKEAEEQLEVYVRSGTWSAGSWAWQQSITGSDTNSGDQFGAFGAAVSSIGEDIVVGAYLGFAGAIQSGAAYYFDKPSSTWGQQQKVIQPSPVNMDNFGGDVVMTPDATTMAISAPYVDYNGDGSNGAIYVFVRTTGDWTHQKTYYGVFNTYANGIGRLGTFALSDDGNTLVFGDTEGTAVLQTYVKTRTAGVWSDTQTIGNAGQVRLSGDGFILTIGRTVYERSTGNFTAYYAIPGMVISVIGINYNGSKILVNMDENGRELVSLFLSESSGYFRAASHVFGVAQGGEAYSCDSDCAKVVYRTYTAVKELWFKDSMAIAAESKAISLVGSEAAFVKRQPFLPRALSLSATPNQMLRGKIFAAESRAVAVSAQAAKINVVRSIKAMVATLSVSAQDAFMLRLKGSVNSVPLNVSTVWPDAMLRKEIPLNADSATFAVQYQESQVARIFTLRAFPAQYVCTEYAVEDTLTATLPAGSMSIGGVGATLLAALKANAGYGVFNLNISKVAMRRGAHSVVSVRTFEQTIHTLEASEVIRAG